MTKISLLSLIIFLMFEKSWKYGKDLFACFVDLEKVQYDCLFISGGFRRRIALMVSCYMPSRHSMEPTGVLWLNKWQAIKAFHIGFELRQKCDLFLLFFIVYMNWIDKCNKADEFVTIGN